MAGNTAISVHHIPYFRRPARNENARYVLKIKPEMFVRHPKTRVRLLSINAPLLTKLVYLDLLSMYAVRIKKNSSRQFKDPKPLEYHTLLTAAPCAAMTWTRTHHNHRVHIEATRKGPSTLQMSAGSFRVEDPQHSLSQYILPAV